MGIASGLRPTSYLTCILLSLGAHLLRSTRAQSRSFESVTYRYTLSIFVGGSRVWLILGKQKAVAACLNMCEEQRTTLQKHQVPHATNDPDGSNACSDVQLDVAGRGASATSVCVKWVGRVCEDYSELEERVNFYLDVSLLRRSLPLSAAPSRRGSAHRRARPAHRAAS